MAVKVSEIKEQLPQKILVLLDPNGIFNRDYIRHNWYNDLIKRRGTKRRKPAYIPDFWGADSISYSPRKWKGFIPGCSIINYCFGEGGTLYYVRSYVKPIWDTDTVSATHRFIDLTSDKRLGIEVESELFFDEGKEIRRLSRLEKEMVLKKIEVSSRDSFTESSQPAKDYLRERLNLNS